MGFFDKVKNMFTEEVEEEVKVEQIKKEVTRVPIESPNVDLDFQNDTIDDFEFNTQEKISKPVFFDDNDFKDLNLIKEKEKEPQSVEKGYNKKEEKEVETKKIFKPTPIISPVYGVLDKNYHKEDIVAKTNVNSDIEDTEPTIDSIRNKAYGTLEDELENTLFGNNSILFKKDELEEENKIQDENIGEGTLSNLTDDIGKELDELLNKKEKYSDDKKLKESNDDSDDDLLNFIDSTLYKEGEDE